MMKITTKTRKIHDITIEHDTLKVTWNKIIAATGLPTDVEWWRSKTPSDELEAFLKNIAAVLE